MSETTQERPVLQLRLVVHADDFDEALRFYRDVLGMPQEEAYAGDGGAQVTILGAGRATLELANTAQAGMIDDSRWAAGWPPHLRLALEMPDSAEATRRATEAGATLVAPPTQTPWRSLSSRLEAPGGVQLTVLQELDG